MDGSHSFRCRGQCPTPLWINLDVAAGPGLRYINSGTVSQLLGLVLLRRLLNPSGRLMRINAITSLGTTLICMTEQNSSSQCTAAYYTSSGATGARGRGA